MKPGITDAFYRGAFHATVGVFIAAGLLLAPRLVFIAALGIVTGIFLLWEMFRIKLPVFGRFFSIRFIRLLRQEETNRFTGSSYFLIGCFLTALLFPPSIAFPAILFLSLGDPAATVFGRWRGRIKMWGKSLEGNIACLIVCLIIAGFTARFGKSLPWGVALTGAFVATLFQALPKKINDNITIPLGSALAMFGASFLV